MTWTTTRRAVAVVLAVTLAVTGAAAPVAAGHQATETGDDHSCEDHGQNEDGSGCSERGERDPSLALEIRLEHGPVAGFFDMECFGSPLDHSCDKDGRLSGGPVAVGYSGNNSADYLNGTSGGGDTITVTAGNQSGSVSFDCTFTRATLTNGTACDGGGSPPGGRPALA